MCCCASPADINERRSRRCGAPAAQFGRIPAQSAQFFDASPPSAGTPTAKQIKLVVEVQNPTDKLIRT